MRYGECVPLLVLGEALAPRIRGGDERLLPFGTMRKGHAPPVEGVGMRGQSCSMGAARRRAGERERVLGPEKGK